MAYTQNPDADIAARSAAERHPVDVQASMTPYSAQSVARRDRPSYPSVAASARGRIGYRSRDWKGRDAPARRRQIGKRAKSRTFGFQSTRGGSLLFSGLRLGFAPRSRFSRWEFVRI